MDFNLIVYTHGQNQTLCVIRLTNSVILCDAGTCICIACDLPNLGLRYARFNVP